MKYLIRNLAWLILLVCLSGEAQMSKSIYDIEIQTIDHQKVLINEYKDKVILIVNTASRCGFTYQYEELQKVYAENEDLKKKMYHLEEYLKLKLNTKEKHGEYPSFNEI